MTLRELLDWVKIQNCVNLFLFNNDGDIEDFECYTDFEWADISRFEDCYVQYMYATSMNELHIDLIRE